MHANRDVIELDNAFVPGAPCPAPPACPDDGLSPFLSARPRLFGIAYRVRRHEVAAQEHVLRHAQHAIHQVRQAHHFAQRRRERDGGRLQLARMQAGRAPGRRITATLCHQVSYACSPNGSTSARSTTTTRSSLQKIDAAAFHPFRAAARTVHLHRRSGNRPGR